MKSFFGYLFITFDNFQILGIKCKRFHLKINIGPGLGMNYLLHLMSLKGFGEVFTCKDVLSSKEQMYDIHISYGLYWTNSVKIKFVLLNSDGSLPSL